MAVNAARNLQRTIPQEKPERQSQGAGVGLARGTAVEGRLRVVFDQQLQRLGELAPVDPVGQRERHVDAGGHARPADVVSLPDDAVTDTLVVLRVARPS